MMCITHFMHTKYTVKDKDIDFSCITGQYTQIIFFRINYALILLKKKTVLDHRKIGIQFLGKEANKDTIF